jgi:hypothetical protein
MVTPLGSMLKVRPERIPAVATNLCMEGRVAAGRIEASGKSGLSKWHAGSGLLRKAF